MRIAFDAQILPGGHHGGVEQVVLNLVRALGRLDGTEEYTLISHWRYPHWLEPYIGPNQKIITSLSHSYSGATRFGPRWISVPARRAWRKLREHIAARGGGAPSVPESKGFYESLNADLVHFPFQGYVRSRLPFIYNPHDLQHLHLPQYFPADQVALRETIYRAGCREARAITVPSQWVKRDIVKQYAIAPEKILVTYWAPSTDVYPPVTEQTLAETRRKFNLPATFAFYPAQPWEHKNHLRLIQALAILRARAGIELPLVLTGKATEFWRVITRQIQALGLTRQVHFLGFVQPLELRALYQRAQFVIQPSLFEGGGLPILEAFREGAPVACAAATSLPEYAGDAALFFDPLSPESIADAVKRMWQDDGLRASLRERGAMRVRAFSWEQTAQKYRALYRRVAGQALDDHDRALLADA
ncbi:MAG: glycosyltransferase family 4 protein [Chloroflexi bacterium]|nr:glycosyltransferase family 4 protein [Chloroflexota bacterium]